MPLLSFFYGIKIYLYFADHPPAHFHARYGGQVAVIAISDGTVILGNIPTRAARLVEEWRTEHRIELQEAWDAARQHENPGTIEPLS